MEIYKKGWLRVEAIGKEMRNARVVTMETIFSRIEEALPYEVVQILDNGRIYVDGERVL